MRKSFLAEWLYEDGIGEARAALVNDGRIVQAIIEPDNGGLSVGTVVRGRLVENGRVALEDGCAVRLGGIPRGLAQGARITVEIVRESIPEPGRLKEPVAIMTESLPRQGPTLLMRITGGDHFVRRLYAHETDALEAHGWSEVLEEARTGDIGFAGGMLRCSPTPAMTLFDVDGAGPLEPLAIAAAGATASAIVRHGIGGSIGIDFPTLQGKAARQAVAAAIDAHLPLPFERTVMNGFGFLQIVRPRPRPSLPELLRADPLAASARACLRSFERTPPGGPAAHRPSSTVSRYLRTKPEWMAELARRTGVVHELEE